MAPNARGSGVLAEGQRHPGRWGISRDMSHLDTRSEEEMEKKVELLASVATALAR